MKIWLDDRRPAPDGWEHVTHPLEVTSLLITNPGDIEAISLDHDLGLFDTGREWTGYDVLLWIESELHYYGLERIGNVPEKISVHSANSVAHGRMLAAIQAIRRKERELQTIDP